MERRICVCLDFLDQTHRDLIELTAQRLGFEVGFFTSAELSEAVSYLQGSEILFSHMPSLLRRGPSTLKWYCCAFAGVDRYCDEPDLFPNPDCMLTNSSGAYNRTIAEHLVMTLLMLLRRMPDYTKLAAEHTWKGGLPVRSIRDVRVCVLGAGNIGSEFAGMIKALGAPSVVGVSRSGDAREPFDEVYPIDELDALLPQVDALVMALPQTNDTRGLLSAERIALLPPDAYVLNVGRGSAIDQAALVEALNEGRLAGAALDVVMPEPLPADDPLWSAANVIITPHVSGNTAMPFTRDRIVELFLDDLENYAAGRPLVRLIDRTRGY